MEVRNQSKYSHYKTAAQWNKAGYVIKRRQQSKVMWTNHFCQARACYYAPEQVRPMSDREREKYRLEQARKRRLARKRLAVRKREIEKQLIWGQREWERQQRIKKLLSEKRTRIADKISTIYNADSVWEYDMVVLDVETTGLNEHQDELLQVSMVEGRGNVLYNGYLRPMALKKWPEAEMVNHITYEMVEDAPLPSAEMLKIAKILYHAKSIVGYNLGFDLGFLAVYGVFPSKDAEIIDVMPLFAEVYGEWSEKYNCYRWQKLEVCTDYYGYNWDGTAAHDSLADCLATLYCYQKMLEDVKNRS